MPMQLQIMADMISDIMDFSREETISEIINTQDVIEATEIENLGVNKSSIRTVVTGEKENNQQVLEINSNLIQESSNVNISTDIFIPGIESKIEELSDTSHKIDVPDQDDNLPNKKGKNMIAKSAIDKSQLPPDVVRVLKNMLDNEVVSVSSDKTQPTKHKIIVAKVPTNALKQMIALKNDGTQVNKLENCTIQSNNSIAKLPTNLAEALKNMIVQKASSQIKKNITKDQVLSDIPSVLNKTHTENVRAATPCQQSNSKFEVMTSHTRSAINENYHPHLCCPSKLSISKYLYDWMLRTRELEYLNKNCDLDFGEYILLSSKKCLFLTLPYSPGFEDERATNTQIIAEEYGTMLSFEFNENCAMEKEFNKIFHYFSCPNISNTTTRETVLKYIFQTMRELMAHLPVQDALKLICNCSLCWFLYVRGKIFSSYYPEENLNYGHSPLASYRTLAIRNIEITDLNPKPDSECLMQDHYFLPIRFKRGGKKRDLNKNTALYSSFNPYLNGNISLKRSKEAEINLELSKFYKLPPTYQDDEHGDDTEDNNEQLSQLETSSAKSVEAVTSNKLTVANPAMSIYVPAVGYSSVNSSAENERNGIHSASTVMFPEIPDETSNLKPMTICSASTYNDSPSTSMFSLKSYAPAVHKSTEKTRRTTITSSSEILSTKNENILDNSILLRNPVPSDLGENKPSEHLKKATFKSDAANKVSDILTPNSDSSNRLKGELMTAIKYSQISKHSQKQMNFLSSRIGSPGSLNIIECATKPNKTEYLNPKKTDCTTKIKNDLITHKSDTLLSDQFEGKASNSDILPATVVPSSNANCKSDFPVSSDSFSVNIKNKTKTSHCQDFKKCLNSTSSVTVSPSKGFKHKLASTSNRVNELVFPIAELSLSGVKCKLQPLVSSNLTSSKLKKQIETSFIQESKECVTSNCYEKRLPNAGIKRKSELPVPGYTTSKKYKQIGTSHIEESEDCLNSVSLVTESFFNEAEYKADFSVSTGLTSAEIKNQAKTLDIDVSQALLKPVASFKNSPKMEVSASEAKKQTESETLYVDKNKLSEKTTETVETTKPISSGINIVKLPSSSNVFGTLQNLGVSGAVNVVNLPSESISGVLKTLGVSNPAPTVSIVKVRRSSLPDSLKTLTAPSSSSGALNIIHVNASTSAKLIPELGSPHQTLQIRNPCSGTIRVVQVSNKNASEFKLPSFIQEQNRYSDVVNVQVSNTDINVMQHPVALFDPVDVSSDNSDAVCVQDASVDPSSQKTPETSNSVIPVSVSENSKKNIDYDQKHNDVFNVVTYSGGTMHFGGFRGFKILD